MPLASTITTSTASGLGATYLPTNGGTERITRVTLDASSMVQYYPPIAPSSLWRRPLTSAKTERFPRPAAGAENHFKTAGSVSRGYWLQWYPASAKVVSGSVLKLDAYVYELYDNVSRTTPNGRIYYPIDAAGIAALQPACATTILGYGGVGPILLAEAASRPSWVVPQPHFSIGGSSTTKVFGPIQNPYFDVFPANRIIYRGGTVWRPITEAWASYGYPIYNGLGPANDWIVYHLTYSQATASPAPTTTVTLEWFDVARATVSTVTFGPYTWQLLTSGGGTDVYAIAVDIDISALTPPSTARGYRMSQTGQAATYLTPRTIIGPGGWAAPSYDLYPLSRSTGGGFVPGLMAT